MVQSAIAAYEPSGANGSADLSGEEQGNTAPPILLQYWHVALRWKWVIAGIIAVTLAAGLVWTLLLTPQFTSTSRVEIRK